MPAARIESVHWRHPALPMRRRLRSNASAAPSITRNPTMPRIVLDANVSTMNTRPAKNPRAAHFRLRPACRYTVVDAWRASWGSDA
jgi:hypothetical protein